MKGIVMFKVSGYTYLNQNFCILFASADDSTLPHECLHGLDLRHSFNSKSTYTYKAMATHNIMDYNMIEDPTDKIKQINDGTEIADIKNNHVRLQQYQLWAWQWKKANKSKFLTP